MAKSNKSLNRSSNKRASHRQGAWQPATATPVWKPILEFVRTLIVAYVFAQFIALLGISDRKSAICFGLGIWVCFPTMILTGSVMWENVPLGVAAIHAGDWLVKALFFSVVFSMWHPKQEKEKQA